jgi:nucleolar complex protein 2
MPVSKSTKKFEKNKLGDVLKQRKAVAKIKQKKQIATKRKERKASDLAPAADVNGEPTKRPKLSKDAPDTSIGEMSMDQFFEGGFQLPELNKKTKPKTGKRKRTPVEEKAGDESDNESESGDDMKDQLAALEEKDPEFYKYLKDNDAELLDFDEDADLAEIDALSASEDEATPRKKQKAGKKAKDDEESDVEGDNDLSMKTVEKWRSSMEKSHSLRAMKEVVLAFRSAVHLNEDTGKQYKYSISDPNGMPCPFAKIDSSNSFSVSSPARHYSRSASQGAPAPPAHQGDCWRQNVSEFLNRQLHN